MVSFSALGRLGRMSLPTNRLTIRNPAPTARKISRNTTRSGIYGSEIRGQETGVRSQERPPTESAGQSLTLADRLPAREAGPGLVPVGDGRLAQLPAQADLPAVLPAGEIDQPQVEPLEL